MRHHRKNHRFNQPKPPQESRDDLIHLDFGTYICPLCGNVIADMTCAIAFGSESHPAHLDCVMNYYREREGLGPNEEITYIGCGQFAIASLKPQFKILRKIIVESKDHIPEWRKNIKQTFMSSFFH